MKARLRLPVGKFRPLALAVDTLTVEGDRQLGYAMVSAHSRSLLNACVPFFAPAARTCLQR